MNVYGQEAASNLTPQAKILNNVSSFKRWGRLLLQSKTGTFGLIVVMLIILVSVFADYISPHDPGKINPAAIATPPAWMEGGNSSYLLGTDHMGRDILSRVIHGSQVSLLVGICAVVVAGIIGMTLGIISGYFGGFFDNVIMRLVDAFLAIPNILFTLVILAIYGPGIVTLIFVLGATNWVMYARIIRGDVLSLKEREFIKAARSIGTSHRVIMFRHILPNVFSSFIVVSTLSVATTIITEASLSFLGLGIQPPTISWGIMLDSGRNYLATSWWMATIPGLAITITVLGIIFLGDWLRDALDPRIQGQR